MEVDYTRLNNFVLEAQKLKDNNSKEDVLRHNLTFHLPYIFPEEPIWIKIHTVKVESNMTFQGDGKISNGFADTLIGKTVFEYEKNLSINSIYQEGYGQVKDYCAAMINKGVNEDEIIGILSDTLIWEAFKCKIITEKTNTSIFGRNDIELEILDRVELKPDDNVSHYRFIEFTNRYFARKGSRKLTGKSLEMDLGFDSIFCRNHINTIEKVIRKAFEDRPDYGEMIQSLWNNLFMIQFGAKEFNISNYINEFYIITIAKFICANILEKTWKISDEKEIKDIINGDFFRSRGLINLVEYDYFGWITNTPYIEELIDVGKAIQKDLSAYDYSEIISEDIFGNIVAQLAFRDNRLLLGQEYTPAWVAKEMVKNLLQNFDYLNDEPRILDMCCGSGVFIIELLNQIFEELNRNNVCLDKSIVQCIQSNVIGFDIDPLAIMLSKVNWVIGMGENLNYINEDIVIPVYNADSLFISTPISL